VPGVVVRLGANLSEAEWQAPLGALQRLALALSSQHSTSARCGGLRYSPITSQNFSSKCWSVDSLNVSITCGLMSLACQMRCTLSGEIPTSFAIVRTLQCVRGFFGRVAFVMTCCTLCAAIDGRRPRPLSSCKAFRPSRSKRCDHLFTRAALTPSCLATSTWPSPFARRRTIAARRLSRFEALGAFHASQELVSVRLRDLELGCRSRHIEKIRPSGCYVKLFVGRHTR
jgi:hypothetical protein